VTASDSAFAQALQDRYLIERELGRGGMAVVYLSRDLRHRRYVALKRLTLELATAVGIERFEREIHLTASLQHPHILSVHDSGEAAGMLWYTMPYVEGESLRERLRRETRLEIDEAVVLAREVAEALDCAHSAGIVHRDVKPENILLSRGHALVADFGIARAIREASETLTQTGFPVGTPAYMSPEQADPGASSVDGRSDIYSLGCVLYEMVTGERPFPAPTARAMIASRLVGAPPDPRVARPEVPGAIAAAIIRALAPEPEARFATAGELAAALRLSGNARSEMHGLREDSLERGMPARPLQAADGRRRVTSTLAAALALPLLLGAALGFVHRPVAWLRLDADLTGLALTTAKEWNIGEEIPVTQAGVSGLDGIVLTGGPEGAQAIESDAILVRSTESSPGRIRLKLDPLLPAGTNVSLTLADGRPGYVLKTDSLESFTIAISGSVDVAVPGVMHDPIDFGESGSATLSATGHRLRVDFIPAPDADTTLTQRLPIRKLNLSRVDQYITRERLATRPVSTVRRGTIAVDGGPPHPLAAGQMLEAASTLGPVAISFKDDRVGLRYEGEVRGLSLGFDDGRQDLMPTMLRWILTTHLGWVLGGLVPYLVFLTLLPPRLLWKKG
jgi:hypothetical protein